VESDRCLQTDRLNVSFVFLVSFARRMYGLLALGVEVAVFTASWAWSGGSRLRSTITHDTQIDM
jgi:hypothetical protein